MLRFHTRRVWKSQRLDQPCSPNRNTIKTEQHWPSTPAAPEVWDRVLQKLFPPKPNLPEAQRNGKMLSQRSALCVSAPPQAAHVSVGCACAYTPAKEKGQRKGEHRTRGQQHHEIGKLNWFTGKCAKETDKWTLWGPQQTSTSGL